MIATIPNTVGTFTGTSDWSWGYSAAAERERDREREQQQLQDKKWRAYVASWEALTAMFINGLLRPPKPTRESEYLRQLRPRCRSPP